MAAGAGVGLLAGGGVGGAAVMTKQHTSSHINLLKFANIQVIYSTYIKQLTWSARGGRGGIGRIFSEQILHSLIFGTVQRRAAILRLM